MTIRIPAQLGDAVEEDDYPERLGWLAALPGVVEAIASGWELDPPRHEDAGPVGFLGLSISPMPHRAPA